MSATNPWSVRLGGRGRELGRYPTAAAAKAAHPATKPSYWRANNKGTEFEYYTQVGENASGALVIKRDLP